MEFEGLRIWEQQQKQVMETQDLSQTIAWDLLQRLIFACEAARKLKIGSTGTDAASLDSTGRVSSYVRRLDRNTELARTNLMGAAYRSFCDCDVLGLKAMLKQMQGLWNDYFRIGDGSVANGVRDMLNRPTDAAIPSGEMKGMTTMLQSERLTWPIAAKLIEIPPELAGEMIDGVYKQFDIDGMKVLRMITPDRVRFQGIHTCHARRLSSLLIFLTA